MCPTLAAPSGTSQPQNLVADLDEKLSDCGTRDVEAGSPHSSPPASDQDDSGSEKEERRQPGISIARDWEEESLPGWHLLLHRCPRRSSSVELQRCEVLPRKLLLCSREPHQWPPWTASTTRGPCTTATRATRPLEQPLVVSHPPTCPTLQAKQCQHLLDREDLGLLQGRAKPQVCPRWLPPTRSRCTRMW